MKNVSIIEAEATVDAPKPQHSPSERSQHAAAREASSTTQFFTHLIVSNYLVTTYNMSQNIAINGVVAKLR